MTQQTIKRDIENLYNDPVSAVNDGTVARLLEVLPTIWAKKAPLFALHAALNLIQHSDDFGDFARAGSKMIHSDILETAKLHLPAKALVLKALSK